MIRRWRWVIGIAGVVGLMAGLGMTALNADDPEPGDRPEWVWNARIFFLSTIQPRTLEEADAYLRWLEEYGYNVVQMVPNLGNPLPVSPEDPRLYERPVWEWEWQKDPEQNRVFKYFAEEAGKRGIRVMYHNMVWSVNAVDYKGEGIPIKPEWLPMTQQTRDGRPVFGGVYTVPSAERDPEHAAHIWLCPLDPTVLSSLREVVPRMMEDLGIDILMGDWNFNGFGCDNPDFRLAYEADTGLPWESSGPVGTPSFGAWRDWVQGQLLVRATADLKKAIKEADPGSIIFGYSANPTHGEFETLPAFVDILGDEVSVRSSFYDWPWQMTVLKYNFAVSNHYDVPVVEFYSTDTRSENFFVWALTHTVGLKLWRLLPWFSQWEAEHAALLNRPRPAGSDVALLYSRQTYVRYSDNWGVYWTGRANDGRPHHPYDLGDYDTQQEGGYGWAGWARVLQDRHQPYDVLLDSDVTPGRLSSYRVLILSNAAALSEQQMEAIRGFVRSGGTLISTYQTSLYDEAAQQRADFGLADVMGVRYQGLRPPPGPWLPGEGGPSFFNDVLGEVEEPPTETQWVAEVEAAPSAQVLASYPTDGGVMPALVFNEFGEGRSLYFSGYPGSRAFFRRKPVGKPDHEEGFIYNDSTDPFYRRLLDATVARAAPKPFLETELPPEIIVNPLWCGEPLEEKLCIHLVNARGSRPENGARIATVPGVDPHLGVGFPQEARLVQEGDYGAGSLAPFPEVRGPVTIRIRDLGLTGGHVVSPDFEEVQQVTLKREDPYVVVEAPSLKRYSIVVLDRAPSGRSHAASPLPSPDFSSSQQLTPIPSPTPSAAPEAPVVAETPTPGTASGLAMTPAPLAAGGRSQPHSRGAFSWDLPIPGWVVGVAAAIGTVVIVMVIAQRRGGGW